MGLTPEIIIDEIDATEIAALPALELVKLEDARLDIPTLSDTIERNFGRRPHLIIDITDPPSPAKAMAAGIEATGPDADFAIRDLAAGVASAARDRATALGVKVGATTATTATIDDVAGIGAKGP